MFTGLIECTGRVERIERRGNSIRMLITPQAEDFSIQPRESVTVDGLCLTVTEFQARSFWVDISSESLNRSTLGDLKPGNHVNLERALRLSDRLGGHLVQGHVDAKGSIEEVRREGEFRKIRIAVPRELMKYIVEKGSVALDGISLTVNEAGDEDFTLMIIPETLKRTTLDEKQTGARVNIEVDILAKYVERLLLKKSTGGTQGDAQAKISLDKLKEEGFL
jgi:riboflavin synthase